MQAGKIFGRLKFVVRLLSARMCLSAFCRQVLFLFTLHRCVYLLGHIQCYFSDSGHAFLLLLLHSVSTLSHLCYFADFELCLFSLLIAYATLPF